VDLDIDTLLRVYDDQLRGPVEALGGTEVTRMGPLHLVTFPGGLGFVGYRDLDGADALTVRRWVAEAVARFEADPEVTEVEWKTRGHDVAPGLHDSLVDHGFARGDEESVMMGPAVGLAVDVHLPEGVVLRRITEEADVRWMSAMADAVFGDPVTDRRADDLLDRLARDPDIEIWVAEAEGGIVSAGRLEPVPDSEVAGIWGGATLPQWRGRGIYRALTAERARSALRLGKRYLQSDSTEFSRPILERSGLVKVTTTTPYVWKRPVVHPPAPRERPASDT